jgi:Integral membrane protein (PIN domain superfamily)
MEIFIIIVLLAVAAETTYLVVRSLRKERMAILAPVFVDTSVLIDGRIIAIAESGFLTRPLYIPRSVVGELQFLADNADTEKRTRARHGLDVISQLQSLPLIKTVIFPDGVKADEGVDNRLLMLAKKHSGSLCTIDYNLNKVAVVEGIEVLNVNELAKSLRMAYLPGEHGFIELTQKGNDQHQAVGHLEDGTMVVVEHAYKQIGSTVEVEFIRSLQTAAGKMMFAKLAQSNTQAESKPRQFKAKGTAPVIQKAIRSPRQTQTPQQPIGEPVTRPPRAPRPVKPAQPKSQPKTASAQLNASRPKQSRRPRSPEESLMDLLNNQE